MKKLKQISIITLAWLSIGWYAHGQQKNDAIDLGSLKVFQQSLQEKVAKGANQSRTTPLITVQTPKNQLELNVEYQSESGSEFTLVGDVDNIRNSSFYIKLINGELRGNIVLKDQKLAYEYFSDAGGRAYIHEKDIDKVLCIEYPAKSASKITDAAETQSDFEVAASVYDLQSLPGAYGCVLLDFDGYYLPPGTGWVNGNALNAAHSGMSDAQIQEAWDLISEDFRPFNVNITTSQAVYDSYPQNRRQRCVFTPTNNAAPGAGGVAFVGGFGYQDWPCWVFILSGKSGGEAASHEIGHTLGLGHDGRTNPNEGYFAGHGDWAPIMGVGYYKPITQWSRGEYAYANNTENDLNIMAGYVGFRGDDHGNNFGSATNISNNAAGNIDMQYGIIERTGDQDMFRFTCGTGNVYLDINTVGRHGDLDVLVRLYEGSTGNQIGTFNGGGLNTRLEAYLDAGTYYISVDGTGAGNPSTNGYSDYASLGSFWISGTIPPGSSGGVVTLYQDCSYGGYAVGLGEGSYTLADLQGRGLVNDDASSIRVQSGYQATLYWDNNFQGSTLVKTGDDDCLVNEGFNDELSSIVVSRVASSSVIEAESYSSMSGVQLENCSEGGQNVGWIEQGDWMAYNGINFPSSGTYLIEYRVASANGGGRLSADLNAGATILGELDIPNTGGWQTWSTISHTVNVNAGTYPFGIYAQAGGWNINWIRITRQGSALNQSSTKELVKSEAIKADAVIYPNPAKNTISISFSGDRAKGRIVNTLGQAVIELPSISSNEPIDISNLKEGVYLFEIEMDKTRLVKRIVKSVN